MGLRCMVDAKKRRKERHEPEESENAKKIMKEEVGTGEKKKAKAD